MRMRHGRSGFLVGGKEAAARRLSQVGDLLLLASVAKTLTESGTHGLHRHSIPLSDHLLLQILRRNSLPPSRKLDFFRWCALSPNFKYSPSTYSQIFRTVCRAGLLHEIPHLISSMKLDGVAVDSRTFKFLLDSFIRSGKFDSALEILDHMEQSGSMFDPLMYDSVVVALVRNKQVSLALSIFFKLLESSDFMNDERNSSSIACNELLVALRRADMRVEFKSVFEKLRARKGFEFDNWGYNTCIHAFGCWGDLDSSLTLFKEMKEKSLNCRSIGPDLCTFNSLIHVLCLVGKIKDALIVWEELKGSGHEPDAFTYRILIQGCSKSYRMDDATKIFNEMQHNGYNPDTIVYNSMLDGLFKVRKLKEACQLFDTMVRDGIRASCWTYNILIDGLFRNGRAEAGYNLFCDLKKKGQIVDGVSYSIVSLQLCKEGHIEEALGLVEEMESRGFPVDLVTITSLLIELHKRRRWDWAEKLMKHVREGDLVPSILEWRAEVENSVKNPQTTRKDYTPIFQSNGDLSEIMSLIASADVRNDTDLAPEDTAENENIDQWSSSPHMDYLADKAGHPRQSSRRFSLHRGRRVQAEGSKSFDIDMVNTFLSIFLAKGKLSLACKLFEIFSDMSVSPVKYTYNTLMSSFVKKGYFNQAWGVLNEMDEKFCPADIATYNLIIQGLGKMGRADLARRVLDKLMETGGYLDIVMYNTLINAFGKAGQIDQSNKLFEQMKAGGINPDVVTFNTLIEVHSKAGRLKDAYKLLKMMLDAGCLPNHVTDTTLDFLGKEIDKLRYQKASIIRNKDDNS